MTDINNTRSFTGVTSILCAAHRSREGVLHGHTWEITAWWEGEPDAVGKRADLDHYLTIFDHAVLADGLAWGESLGRAILIGLGCAKVEVRRPSERIYALVTLKGG